MLTAGKSLCHCSRGSFSFSVEEIFRPNTLNRTTRRQNCSSFFFFRGPKSQLGVKTEVFPTYKFKRIKKAEERGEKDERVFECDIDKSFVRAINMMVDNQSLIASSCFLIVAHNLAVAKNKGFCNAEDITCYNSELDKIIRGGKGLHTCPALDGFDANGGTVRCQMCYIHRDFKEILRKVDVRDSARMRHELLHEHLFMDNKTPPGLEGELKKKVEETDKVMKILCCQFSVANFVFKRFCREKLGSI